MEMLKLRDQTPGSTLRGGRSLDRFQKNSAKVAGYCKSHKSETLPTAIKNLGLWQ